MKRAAEIFVALLLLFSASAHAGGGFSAATGGYSFYPHGADVKPNLLKIAEESGISPDMAVHVVILGAEDDPEAVAPGLLPLKYREGYRRMDKTDLWAVAQMNPDNSCVVLLRDNFFRVTRLMQEYSFAHELGHCRGFLAFKNRFFETVINRSDIPSLNPEPDDATMEKVDGYLSRFQEAFADVNAFFQMKRMGYSDHELQSIVDKRKAYEAKTSFQQYRQSKVIEAFVKEYRQDQGSVSDAVSVAHMSLDFVLKHMTFSEYAGLEKRRTRAGAGIASIGTVSRAAAVRFLEKYAESAGRRSSYAACNLH